MPDVKAELTVEDLLQVHALGIENHGGGNSSVPIDAAARMGSVLYTAAYNDGLLGYAAGILCYIARAQHFIDGSKRTAWGGCVLALERNGYTLSVGTEEAAAFVLRVTNENLEPDEVAEQLAEWLIELPDPA